MLRFKSKRFFTFSPPGKLMKILSWNVNGIRAAIRKGFYEWLDDESPEIMCLQETKALPEQVDGLSDITSKYRAFWNNPFKKGYAGVAVFTKKDPVNVHYDLGLKKFDTEGRALICEFKDFTLINVYFPNGGMGEERLKYKMRFYDVFLDYVDSLKNRNIVICGDVNTAHKEIDLARPKANEKFTGFLPEERAWIDKFLSHGYIDTFRMFNDKGENYSWWDYKTRSRERNVGWRIDYFFVTDEFKGKVKDAFIMPDVYGSDHCPVGIEL